MGGAIVGHDRVVLSILETAGGAVAFTEIAHQLGRRGVEITAAQLVDVLYDLENQGLIFPTHWTRQHAR